MRALLILLPLALFACEGGTLIDDDTNVDTEDSDTEDTNDTEDTSDTSDTGDTGDTGTGCIATLVDIRPVDSEGNVGLDVIVTATLSDPVGAGEWSLTVDGVTGTSLLGSSGQVVTFTPDAALTRTTSYTARLSVCDTPTVVTFETLGSPVPTPNMIGRTYAIPQANLTWVKPEAAALVTGMIQFDYFLFYVEDITTTVPTITTWASLGVDSTATPGTAIQDECTEPRTFGTLPFLDNPEFEVGPADFTFDVQGTPVGLQGAHIRAVFVDNGDAIENFEISGMLDTRPLDALIPITTACDGLAALAGGVNPCVACSDSQIKCLDTVIQGSRGDHVPSLTFDTTVDPTQIPACN